MRLVSRLHAAGEGVVIAVDSIRSNKVRAGLTILGVAIGVLAVVLMSAAIHGINSSVARDFEAAGPTSFYVSRYPISFENCDGTDATCKWLRNPPLTTDDAAALAALPGVRGVTAQLQTQARASSRGRALPAVSVDAYSANWVEIDGGDIAPGRSFTPAEASAGARVALVNEKFAQSIFGPEVDPIGREFRLGDTPFQVIGVYRSNASFLQGGDNSKVIVSIEAARRHLGARMDWLGLTVRPRAGVARDDAIDDATAVLRARRGLRPGAQSTFAIITQDMLFETWGKLTNAFFLVMLVLASVGLIVGGVGVVAIMMISVTERTREIGVRKALGATRGAILLQFLVEAVTLTGIGASAGLVAGWLLAALVRAATPVAAQVPAWAVAASLGASAVTGVVFGLLPAVRASRLDPVEALRYE